MTVLATALAALATRELHATGPTPPEGPPEGPPAAPPAPVPSALVPPAPLAPLAVPYPSDAPPVTEPVVVVVKLVIDADGHVATVTLVSAGTDAAGAAVTRAAAAFAFTPATLDGKPVAVEIAFTHTFLPPIAEPTPALASSLRGRLRERATHTPIAGASVSAVVAGATYATESDAKGRFRLPLPAGDARILVRAVGYHDFLQREALTAGEELAVGYFIDADRYDPYEIVVHAGNAKREEVSRVTLGGHEAKAVAGTLGDPFRVVQALPGVGSIMSLLPFPIVRGTSPGSTGFLIDGVEVPLLYHLMAGPSVVNPNFIDEVAFYPGGFPVSFGGFTAGIVDGHTRRAGPDERAIDIDLNLAQVGAFVRQPIAGTSLSVAGRYGYPGLLMSLVTDQVALSYWDYQLRFDVGSARQGFTVFAYGAGDSLVQKQSKTGCGDGVCDIEQSEQFWCDEDCKKPRTEPTTPADASQAGERTATLALMFHRLELRYLQRSGPVDGVYRLVLGYDETVAAADAAFRTMRIGSLMRWRLEASGCLALDAGLDLGLRDTHALNAAHIGKGFFDFDYSALQPRPQDVSGGAFIEGVWRPWDALVIRPGLRVDGRWDGETTAWTIDPRLTVRARLLTQLGLGDDAAPTDEDAIWLKASVGLYHQPPRLPAPLPGLESLPLRFGQLEAIQSSLGLELPFAGTWRLDTEAYYSALDPIIMDLTLNRRPDSELSSDPRLANAATPSVLDSFVTRQVGRAFGAELMLRRRDIGPGIHGWLAYTLSRSERKRDGRWVPFDFDRTHLVSLVIGWTLPRNWEVSMRLQYQSGKPRTIEPTNEKPDTTIADYNATRGEGNVRLDVRVDKHAVWNDWVLDFYLDLTNAAMFPEPIGWHEPLRYVLPVIGVRGRL